MKTFFLALALLTATVGGAGASYASQADFTEFKDPFESAPAPKLADPLESFNRISFWLNDQIYTRVLAPVCQAIPEEIRGLAERVWSPLQTGGAEFSFAFRDAGSEVGRLMLHAMVTLLNRLEPEKTADLADGREDVDATLRAFGVGPGYYLVLPILGPTSVREEIGRLTAFYLEPTPCVFSPNGNSRPPAAGKSMLDELETYLAIRRDSLDPYLFVRDAYAQRLSAEGDGSRGTQISRRIEPSRQSG